MSTKDDKTDPTIEVFPPGQGSRELAQQEKSLDLPELGLPPPGVIKTAFMTAIRFSTEKRAIAAYKNAVAEAVGARIALANLERAKLEHQKATRLLEDAETIHKADAAKRKEQLINAQQSLRKAEAKAEIADMERERSIQREEDKHKRWHQKRAGEVSGIDLDDLTEDEQELVDEMKSVTQPAQHRMILDLVIEDWLHERGGEPNLTAPEKACLKSMREKADELIRDSLP